MAGNENQEHSDKDISAKVMLGAALVGVGGGALTELTNKAEEARSQAAALIEPGDQRHIPHPWENFKNRVLWVYNYVVIPGDMNLKHSPHPAETAMQLHTALVNQTADILTEQGLVEGVRLTSAAVGTVAVDSADPFKKLRIAESLENAANTAESLVTKPTISWHDYAHLLGEGSQTPKLKPLRDFSGLMEYRRPMLYEMDSNLSYNPRPDHKLEVHLSHVWSYDNKPRIVRTEMDYLVKVNPEFRGEHGSGSEMYHSALQLIQGHYGIRIDSLEDSWHGKGALTTNYDAFVNARAQGAGLGAAVRSTPSGRWAADAGFTEVGGRKFNREMADNKPHENLHPQFTRPVFSNDDAYNVYGNAWASSQGRSSQQLIPRQKPAEASTTSSKPELPLTGYSETQAETLRRFMYEHIEQHFDTLINGRRIEPEK